MKKAFCRLFVHFVLFFVFVFFFFFCLCSVESAQMLHRCQIVVNEMSFFLTNLNSYYFFEVITPAWTSFQKAITEEATGTQLTFFFNNIYIDIFIFILSSLNMLTCNTIYIYIYIYIPQYRDR